MVGEGILSAEPWTWPSVQDSSSHPSLEQLYMNATQREEKGFCTKALARASIITRSKRNHKCVVLPCVIDDTSAKRQIPTDRINHTVFEEIRVGT